MKKVIMDIDPGVDDALAMAYALHSPELDVIGFTTCFGNVTVSESTRNTLAVLNKLNKPIPVYEGGDLTFARGLNRHFARSFHGEDGLGNTLENAESTQASSGDAVDFIIRQIRLYPNEISLIAVGPLTNIALAISKAPDIISICKEIVIMGGAVKVPGNVTPYSEANIWADPEAADYVFTSGAPVTMVGLDVTLQTLLHRSNLELWRNSGKEAGSFFAAMTELYMEAYKANYPHIGGCPLHDPLAVGVVIDPSMVTTESLHVRVVLEGEETGRTVGLPEGEPKIQVSTKVDAERFVIQFLDRVL